LEPILDPDLPIIDPHHHLWLIPERAATQLRDAGNLTAIAISEIYRKHPRYLFDDFLVDINSGHNIRATVYIDAHSMYRAAAPAHLKSVGEIEFVNGMAAMSASGLFGDTKVCAGIVGGVDLSLGEAVEEVLHAHLRAGGDRYRGVRDSTMYDDDQRILGSSGVAHGLANPAFREGFRKLQPLGLSFDTLVLEPQLPDVLDLARSFPETQIIVNHLGVPVGVGRFLGKRQERFNIWRDNIRKLATCDNVTVKLGGIGSPFAGYPSFEQVPPPSSQQLASEWKPYIETCIEAFGVKRCMFEGNFPMDSSIGRYSTVWNTFKRITSGASAEEKHHLFSGTAARIYRLEI
jgi:predicted TIM-barrel fold metal-dependent hydrolase